jgi:penicillin-binding protein 1A
MVCAYGTIANQGAYLEPVMVTRIEDRKGEVLETFRSASPEQALPLATVQTLLDVMRGVIDRGTGTSIRTRFGIRADVAGKTGTTQDNADGWFIMMHPQLVAGAWVGFNDSRVTLRSDYWGQGAHSALPMVGDFFQRSLRARVIDPNVRFVRHEETGIFDALGGTMRGWFQRLFGPAPKPQALPAPRAQSPPPPKMGSALEAGAALPPGGASAPSGRELADAVPGPASASSPASAPVEALPGAPPDAPPDAPRMREAPAAGVATSVQDAAVAPAGEGSVP